MTLTFRVIFLLYWKILRICYTIKSPTGVNAHDAPKEDCHMRDNTSARECDLHILCSVLLSCLDK